MNVTRHGQNKSKMEILKGDVDCYNFFSLIFSYYPLANEVAKGYSNATVRPSFHNILVTTLELTSFTGF